MNLSRVAARHRADMYFSRIVRARGRCQRCGATRSLECAHIIRRGYDRTRCDEMNALCLCTSCHRWFTDYPEEWQAYIGDAEYSRLWKLANADGQRVDWNEILDTLRRRAKALRLVVR